MKKLALLLAVLFSPMALAASAIDGTIPKAPYPSTTGTCITGYKYENGMCNWKAASDGIRNNFAAAKSEIEALQTGKLSTTSPIVISGDCSGTGVAAGTAVSCTSLLRVSNNLSDLANAATARTNLGLGTAATQNVAAFLQPLNNLSEVTNTATARANIGADNASNLTSGTVATARLGSGTANNMTFLRGDNTWQTVTSGGTPGGTNGQIQFNNAGAFGGVTAVPIANGGTGQTNSVQAQNALGMRGYVLASNNASLPNNIYTNANWVNHNVTTHIPGNSDYTCPRVKFVNWYLGTTSENQGSYAFYIRAGWWDGFKFTRLKFNGQVDYLLSNTWGNNEVWSDPDCSIKLTKNQPFKIYSRRVAADAGAAGTYNHITNTSGRSDRQDGLIQGNDPTVDYTMGAGIAYGATYLTPVISSGAITSIPIDPNAKGIGYTAGQNAWCYYGGAGVNTPGALYPGSGALSGGFCGFTANNGGTSNGITLGSGGSGYSSSAPPICGCAGTGTAGTGFGTNTSNYGPSAIIAIPNTPTCSLVLDGDSIMAGFTSVDGFGNIVGSHGLWEQEIAGICGLTKIAVSGESILGRLTAQTRRNAFVQDIINQGTRISHALIQLGTNDFLTNTNSDVVSVTQGYLANLRDIYKNMGIPKVYGTTVMPALTAGSSKVDQSLMTPYNVNHNPSGRVSQYNSALLSGTPAMDGIANIAATLADPVTPNLPRVNAFPAANRSCGTTSGSNVVTMADTSNLFPTATMGVSGTGIPAGATISTVTANTQITMSQNATATGTITCSFTTALMAGDGVHPSVAVGIPYSVINLTLPSFAVP